MINSFNDFYNNLSSNGLFFFWIVVFLFVFVIFLLVILLLKNRKLSKYLKENNIKEELNDTHDDTPLILSEAKEEPKEIVKELPKQEIIEPNNIKGVRITKENDNLRIENTDLNLNIILEKYAYLSDNILDLDSFIENYKNNNESKFSEKNDELILETVDNSNNKNPKHKKLYIDRKTANPIKMEIKDTNKNSTIYIIYNEVKVNSLN